MSAILAPAADGESNRPLMAASIGVCIVAAREVGKPDPTDDELRRGLKADGFLEIEIRDGFAHAKAMALAALKDAAALTEGTVPTAVGKVFFTGASTGDRGIETVLPVSRENDGQLCLENDQSFVGSPE